MLDKREFYINGQWTAPNQTNDFNVIDPSTEQICGVISLGDQVDTDAAVAAANVAFENWSRSFKEERIALLERILDCYNKRSNDIAQAISLEMGAPIDMAKKQQVGAGAWHINGFIDTLKNFEFDR